MGKLHKFQVSKLKTFPLKVMGCCLGCLGNFPLHKYGGSKFVKFRWKKTWNNSLLASLVLDSRWLSYHQEFGSRNTWPRFLLGEKF